MKFRAAIQINGKTFPVFAGRKHVYFQSLEKARTRLEKMARVDTPARGLVWPAGTSLAAADWSQVYTIAL